MSFTRYHSALLSAAAVLLTAATASGALASQNTAGARSAAPQLRSLLNDYLSARATAEHISAVSLRVTYAGRRPSIAMTVGTARYGAKQRVAPDAIWPIGSNTKAFTSALLLQLEAHHKLSIHDTLGRWLHQPKYRPWRRITIEQLLNMTSGIPTYNAQPAFLRTIAASLDTAFSASRLVSYSVGLPLQTGWTYSNTNYVLAQMVVERVTHDTYAHQLRKWVLAPLGLRNTFYSAGAPPSTVTARVPSGYFFDSSIPELASILGRDQRHRNPAYTQGSGGIVGSLADMARWARALYRGPFLPTEQRRELTSLVSETTGRPLRAPTATEPKGFGLGVMQYNAGSAKWWIYEGVTFGYRVFHLYDPASRVVIVLAANSNTAVADDGISALGQAVMDVVSADDQTSTPGS